MSGIRQGWAVLGLGVLFLVFAAVLLTKDIYADEAPQYGDAAVSGSGDSCGSAYDIVFLRGDGDMGGETPDNQSDINAQCVRAAGTYVAGGTVVGTLALVCLVGGAVGVDRARRDPASTSVSGRA